MFCFNDNYAVPAAACFISIMEHSSAENEYFFNVLHSDISAEHQKMLSDDMKKFPNCRLIFTDMNNKFETEFSQFSHQAHYAKEVLYKLCCASIFPEEEKMIITDVDVIFLDDIAQMYDAFEPDEDFYFAGIGGIKKTTPNFIRSVELYKKFDEEDLQKLENGVGGGFLLTNLKKIREDGIEKKMADYLISNVDRLLQAEQDVINLVCHKSIKKLPKRYMVCSYSYDDFKNGRNFSRLSKEENPGEIKNALENPVQLHYASEVKPWKFARCTKSEIWFEYFRKSVFARIYLKEILRNSKSIVLYRFRNALYRKIFGSRLWKCAVNFLHSHQKLYSAWKNAKGKLKSLISRK
jgi:lipopolysaccharide biosynthesis glycosyltransferase